MKSKDLILIIFSSQLQGYFWNTCETDSTEVFFSLVLQLLCIGLILSLFVEEIFLVQSLCPPVLSFYQIVGGPANRSCPVISKLLFRIRWCQKKVYFLNLSTFTRYEAPTNASPSNPTQNLMIRHPNCDFSDSKEDWFISPSITSQPLLTNHLMVQIK